MLFKKNVLLIIFLQKCVFCLALEANLLLAKQKTNQKKSIKNQKRESSNKAAASSWEKARKMLFTGAVESFFFFQMLLPVILPGRSSLWENEENRQTTGTLGVKGPRIKVPFSTNPSTSAAAAALVIGGALNQRFLARYERVGSRWLRRTTSFCLTPLWVTARPQIHFLAKCRKMERAGAFLTCSAACDSHKPLLLRIWGSGEWLWRWMHDGCRSLISYSTFYSVISHRHRPQLIKKIGQISKGHCCFVFCEI